MTSAIGARTQNKSAGFTLVELMVVAALFLVLLSLSWPAFSGLYRSHRLESAAHELSACMALARSEAVISESRHALRLESGPAGYSLYKLGESSLRVGKRRTLPADIRLSIESTSGGARSGAGAGAGESGDVYFYPNGTATAARFLLEDPEGAAIVLKLDGFTGQTRVVEEAAKRES